jgi:hypothetical protein
VSPIDLTILTFCLLVGAVAATHKNGLTFLSFCIGFAAGFVQFQVSGLHVYTIFVVFYVLIAHSARRGVLAQSLSLIFASILVASTVLWGDLVTSDGLAVQLIVMAVSSALFLVRSTGRDLVTAQYGLIALTTIGALAAIGQAIGVVPAQLLQLAGAESGRPSGIYPEPDWLGLFSAAGLLLIWVGGARGRIRFPLIAIHLFGVLLASARAAIIGLLVVVAFSFVTSLLNRRRNNWRRKGTIFLAISVAVFVFVLAFPTAVELVVARMAGLLPHSGDGVVTARFGQTSGLLQFAAQAPWYGHGLSASGRVNGFGEVQYSMTQQLSSTGSNWLAGLWADAKFLSIPLIGFLGIAIMRRAGSVGSLLLVLVLVNSLASNAFFFPLTWFAIVLCLATPAQENFSAISLGSPGVSAHSPRLRRA